MLFLTYFKEDHLLIIKGKIDCISYHKETFILIQKNNNNATILEYIEQ